VGQSTGGFTDCLLQQGAAQVVGVDVGHGQLHPSLRSDARVVCIEGVNARSLTAADLVEHHRRALMVALDAAEAAGTLQDQPELLAALDAELDPVFDFLTGDLSFISLTLVLPAVVRLLKPGGEVLMLVKPQFELQPGQIGKGGIVRDPVHFEFVEKRLRDCCASLGLDVLAWLDSPIEGGDGNHEFFIQARKGMDAVDDDLPLPTAPARQAAKRVPRSATRSLLDAMDQDGEAAHAGQPGPARSKRREKKNAAD
jgi:23S rRNA (cytidine1920-2'-O)/16S rRNA (cytidine1409-2'-O)-methyltransferase